MGKVQVELVNGTEEDLTIREEVTVGSYNKDVTLDANGGLITIKVDPNSTYFVMWVIKGEDGSNVVDLTSDQLIDNERITIVVRDGRYIAEPEPRQPTVVKYLNKATKMFSEKKPSSETSNHPVNNASGSRGSNHAPPMLSIRTQSLPPQEPVPAEPAAPAGHKHKRPSFFSFFRRS